MTKELLTAQIVAAHGRHYLADTGDKMLHCFTRGKKSDVAVGDNVHILSTAKGQAVIESVGERRSLLYRSDQYKSKFLAANIDRLFIVVATEPGFSDDLVSRALVAAEAAAALNHRAAAYAHAGVGDNVRREDNVVLYVAVAGYLCAVTEHAVV